MEELVIRPTSKFIKIGYAVVIVLFMAFHVFGMKGLLGSRLAFSPAHATESAAYHMQASALIPWVVYPIGILASCYHLANGFWAAAITWGLTISKAAQRRWGFACGGLFVLTFGCGMTAWRRLRSWQRWLQRARSGRQVSATCCTASEMPPIRSSPSVRARWQSSTQPKTRLSAMAPAAFSAS